MNEHPDTPIFDDNASAAALDRARRDAPVFSPVEEAETIRLLAALPTYEPRRDIAPAVMEAVTTLDAAEMAAAAEALRAIPPPRPRRDITVSTMNAVRHIAKKERARPFLHLPSRAALLRTAAIAALLLGVAGLLVRTPGAAPARGRASNPRTQAGAWLLERQRPGGGWDEATLGGHPECAPALTALGLLALHREAPDANREAVRRGAFALCAMQEADGGFGRGAALRLNQNLATAVLIELNRDLRSPLVGEAIARALAFSRRNEALGDGAWAYSGSGASKTRRAAAGLFGAPSDDAWLRAALRDGLRDLPRFRPAREGAGAFYGACLTALDLG